VIGRNRLADVAYYAMIGVEIAITLSISVLTLFIALRSA
jgi:hypothetical protein